jgi:NitT/TauT family transport system permease protein
MASASPSTSAAGVVRGHGASWFKRNERLIYGFVGFFGFLLLWELGSRAGVINGFFFSRPTAILAAGVTAVQTAEFQEDLRVSFFEFGIGYLAAILVGVPLGLAAGWYRRLQYLLDPWINFLNSLPRFALMPVVVIWVGLGMSSKIVIVFLGAFFAIIIPTIQGVRTVDRRLLDVASSFNASRRRIFVSVVAPATVPFIVTGLRLGIARALIGVVTAELYAATVGLGVFIKKASDTLATDRLLFGVLIFTITGLIGVELIRQFERYFQRWRPVKQGTQG